MIHNTQEWYHLSASTYSTQYAND